MLETHWVQISITWSQLSQKSYFVRFLKIIHFSNFQRLSQRLESILFIPFAIGVCFQFGLVWTMCVFVCENSRCICFGLQKAQSVSVPYVKTCCLQAEHALHHVGLSSSWSINFYYTLPLFFFLSYTHSLLLLGLCFFLLSWCVNISKYAEKNNNLNLLMSWLWLSLSSFWQQGILYVGKKGFAAFIFIALKAILFLF